MAEEHIERTNGPTPNGGAYFIAYYYDQDLGPIHRTRAWYVEIHEFTEDEELIQKHFAYLGNPDEYECEP